MVRPRFAPEIVLFQQNIGSHEVSLVVLFGLRSRLQRIHGRDAQ